MRRRGAADRWGLGSLAIALMLVSAVFISHGLSPEFDMHHDDGAECMATTLDPSATGSCSEPLPAELSVPVRLSARSHGPRSYATPGIPTSIRPRYGPPDLQIFRT